MNNILDYLEWRGDLSFEQDPFNEVDNLILSTLAYIDFDGIVSFEVKSGRVVLADIAQKAYDAIDLEAPSSKNPFFVQIPGLLCKVAATVRFGRLELSNYINRINFDNSEQFSAIVFSLSNNLHYIAFRGTDDTLIGWKEDFQMSFMDVVQAQKDAVEYVKYILHDLEGSIYLGGHSKGGNLAVYAAASLEEVNDRILAVYNNDGPGFQEKFLESEGYHNVLNKLHTIMPKSSIVGMLMEHLENYVVVNSNQIGIGQHNVFSWEVLGNHFVYKPSLKKSSIILNRAIRGWLSKISVEERATFVEEMFDIIYSTGLITVSALSTEKQTAANGMIKAYKNMNPETKKFMKKLIYLFVEEGQKVLKLSIEEDINLLRINKKQNNKSIVNKKIKGYIKLNVNN
jgi:hypothetical protein